MRSLYALHLSLSVAIPAVQPRLCLSGTNRFPWRSAEGYLRISSQSSLSLVQYEIESERRT
ncbi:MAG: hypothetical protein KZQ63_05435 [Candidatus Thiodiazotropha sp. (ex Lucinoma aequizonata)]|nr:hypothetical protein [Candidatus Thiodiazotropha sp. (ex Lucinoma aequizonata)]